ncbi:putative hydroxymethylpyrimidine transport system permease protein [Paenochrobactrum gallinarii]|uniref:Putative hydroxymethylpyrimidine transport system permease protein n=1 Tax=Paenochrobactrum gallinarii TaxID=643673 RepID=A0A841LZ09_9HYPH|nr:ABC transporter permease [Paenochrobactrum gallinarii]MBB6261737.1 putative hydroxymethylpyrimidine transport system permease protein [Paenochrobactrum gallinarii]
MNNRPVALKTSRKFLPDGVISALTALLLWQGLIWLFAIPRFILPGPVDVIIAFYDNIELLIPNALITFGEILSGLVLGSFIGIIVAIALMLSPLAQRIVLPMLIFSQTIPIFALAPILTLWLGYGVGSKIAITVLMIFFPVVSTFLDGLRRTDQSLLDAAAILGSNQFSTLFRVRIPAAFPSLASGLSLAAVYAPIGAIIGEWVGASKGLGYLMLLANGRAKTDLMFAALFILVIFTLILHKVIAHFARKLAVWPQKP